MEKKLSPKQMICNVCGGNLRELKDEEKKKIRVKFSLPRGVFVCEECEGLATVGLTPVDLEKSEWREIIEVLDKDELLTEREAIEGILEAVSSLPDSHTSIVSIGKLFRCQGKGVKCSLYKTASCGSGQKEFCPGGWCNYDPYPEEYKKLFWYKVKSSWPKDKVSVLEHWFNIIGNGNDSVAIVDAVNRVSTIATRKVSNNLCGLFFKFRKINLKIAETVLAGLIKQDPSSKIQKVFSLGLSHNSPLAIQLFILNLLRLGHCEMFDIVELSNKVSHLTTRQNKAVRESARKTLMVLKTRASKEKPDLKT